MRNSMLLLFLPVIALGQHGSTWRNALPTAWGPSTDGWHMKALAPKGQQGRRMGEMMTRLLIVLAMLASLPLAFAQCPPMGSSTGASPTLKVDVRAKAGSVKAGSPLLIDVTLSNSTDHDISFWKSTNPNYAVEVVDETGKPLPDKRPGFRRGRLDPTLLDPKNLDPKLVESGEIVKMLSGSLVCVTMKPGENLVDRIDVSKFYDMNAPGSYTISVEGIGTAKTSAVKSNSVKVLVHKD